MSDARTHYVTVNPMGSQSAIEALLGRARLETYLSAAYGDIARATDLYLWATQLSGALHGQISFVEIAVRNSLDLQLGLWNRASGHSADWSAENQAAEPLYALLGGKLREARGRAIREGEERHPTHPRAGAVVTHDDVIAQLMFGSWVTVVRPISNEESPRRQQRLWTEALSKSFPYALHGDAGRIDIGKKLDTLRRLRNRVAHHDNLLRVDVHHRLNGMLSLMAKMDPSYPSLATGRSTLRRLLREDPRRTW
jgi:hypothetical protein